MPYLVAAGLVVIVGLAVGLVALGGGHEPPTSDLDARSATSAAPVDSPTPSSVPDLTDGAPGLDVPPSTTGAGDLPTATRERFIANLERSYEPEMASCIADELFAQTEQPTLDRLAAVPFDELTSLERAVANNAFLACARSVWGMDDQGRLPPR